MDREDVLKWLQESQTFDVDVKYIDVTPVPPLNVNGDSDFVALAAKVVTSITTHPIGEDVLKNLGQWMQVGGWMYKNTIISLKQFKDLVDAFQDAVEKRVSDVEQRMTTQETTYENLIKELTDADKGDAAAEVIAARTSSLYGAYATVKERLDAMDARIGSVIPGGFDVTIVHNAGRNPDSVLVDYYEDAIGTEIAGLGTSPYGLGGSEALKLQVTTSNPDSNTVVVTLPITYQMNGTPELHSDGYWYLIVGNKTLRFKLLGSDGQPISSTDTGGSTTTGGDDTGGSDASTPSTGTD